MAESFKRRRRRVTLAAAVATAVLLPGALAAPAFAERGGDHASIADPAAVVGEIAPQVLSQTAPQSDVSIHPRGKTLSADKRGGQGKPVIEVPAPNPSAADQMPGIEFTVDYAVDQLSETSGITSLTTSTDSVVAHVQPTEFGVRVMTAIADASAPESYAYTFNVPADTKLVDYGDVYYLENGDETYGSLLKAWATDASGNEVPTFYTWDGQTLTQHVDLSDPDIAFPVLADPGWSYSYTSSVWITVTPAEVYSRLKTCFNCYFPVSGAPKAYPTTGQLLPLKAAWIANMECTFTGNRYDSYGKWSGFRFDATKNHLDGLGSYIMFTFSQRTGGTKLLVSAYIVNTWMNNDIYKGEAYGTWELFARSFPSHS